jgi:mannose-6-phosphate isomerase-like protein (cupin superfamily)
MCPKPPRIVEPPVSRLARCDSERTLGGIRARGSSGARAIPLRRDVEAAVRFGGCDSFEMPDWTKKNFDELRDVSPRDLRVQWRFARQALRSPELGVSRFSYEPGARMPWGHRHRVQEEAYIVVAGSGRAKLDDEVVELSAWDVLRVAPAVIRSFEAGPEGLDMICIGGRKPKGGDTERFEDFWN